MSGKGSKKSMVLGGKEIPHKCAEIKSSQIGNDDFYYNKKEVDLQLCQNG